MVLLKLRTPSGAEFCSRALAVRGFGMPPQQDPLYTGLGQAVRIGTELLAALIVGGGLGWVVDTYLFGTTPWGLVMGLVFGLAAGMRNAYRSAQRWQGPSDNANKQE
ncbi:MAG: ATP synthase protein I [Nitrospira sp.]|jgi:ATP synthase protein I|nr:MAG: ATP synthase protein I [Nitrospira sp.]